MTVAEDTRQIIETVGRLKIEEDGTPYSRAPATALIRIHAGVYPSIALRSKGIRTVQKELGYRSQS